MLQGEEIDPYYFSKYPNNLGFLLFSYYFLKLNAYIGVFSGDRQILCIVLFNYFPNTISCLLVYKTAALLTRKRYAFAAFLLSVFSLGLSPWSLIPYTDALGLIFPILTLYVYLRPAKHRVLACALSAVVGTVGYFLKPQCAILLIAVFIVEFVYLLRNRTQIKPFLLSLLCVLLTFTSVSCGIQALAARKHITIDRETSFGPAHFFMMGLNSENPGVYLASDVRFSESFPTKEARTKANLEVALSRIREMGASGLAKHLGRKMLTLFNDGTFAWTKEGHFFQKTFDPPNTRAARFLRSFLYKEEDDTSRETPRFRTFLTFEQFVWISVLLFGAASLFIGFSHEHAKVLNILWLTLIGLILFEMLFEVRARYLYTNVPLFCVLSAFGLEALCARASSFFRRIKEHLSPRKTVSIATSSDTPRP